MHYGLVLLLHWSFRDWLVPDVDTEHSVAEVASNEILVSCHYKSGGYLLLYTGPCVNEPVRRGSLICFHAKPDTHVAQQSLIDDTELAYQKQGEE